MKSEYVVTVDWFDGFEGYFSGDYVVDGESVEEVEKRATEYFVPKQETTFLGQKIESRPYFQGFKVQILKEWVESHKAPF